VDAKRLKGRAYYSGRIVVASSGTAMSVSVYVRTLPTRWQIFEARVRITMPYAARGLLAGLLASLTALAWGKGLTLFLREEGTGNIPRDLVVASALVCALIMSGLADRTRGRVFVVAGCLTGAILGAVLAITLILIGLFVGQLPPTGLIVGGTLFSLLVGIMKGLTRKP
jgi:hypothetical protein